MLCHRSGELVYISVPAENARHCKVFSLRSGLKRRARQFRFWEGNIAFCWKVCRVLNIPLEDAQDRTETCLEEAL